MATVSSNHSYDGVQQMNGDSWLFYYGVSPGNINSLPIGAEFEIVYTFRWKLVQFRVGESYQSNPNIYVESKRSLEQDEIKHFAALVAGLK